MVEPTTEAGRTLARDLFSNHRIAASIQIGEIEREAVAAFVWKRLEATPGFNEEMAQALADVKASRVHRWEDVKRRLDEEGVQFGDPDSYEAWVERVAAALHDDCELEWQAIAVTDPTRAVTKHLADAHYGRAHDLVRRLDLAPSDVGGTDG